MGKGCVFLVGAGPGDPGLLTVRGLNCIRQADVVLYDALVNVALLDEVPFGCEKIYVGKRAGYQARQQEEINDVMVEKAREGQVVVRLKGGDPYLFGRGGVEAEVLMAAGIRFEVVPGISSAVAGPAYAGIPVTHRGVSRHVTFITGHSASLDGQDGVDWGALARAGGTLVILMGASNREEVARRLIEGGYDPGTPVAAVRWGTLPVQKTVRTTLSELADVEVRSPSVIVVGEVAALNLNWFECRPLFGRCIAVTRATSQAREMVHTLIDLGAEVLETPAIQIVEPADWRPVDQAILDITGYDWVVFTSSNAVSRFFGRLQAQGLDARGLGGVQIGVVGAATAATLRDFGVRADLCPERQDAEGLSAAFASLPEVHGQRFLLPRPEVGRETLPRALRDMGATVCEIVVYRTICPVGLPEGALERFLSGEVDLVVFTSSSTAENFSSLLGAENLEVVQQRVRAACIGPATEKKARELGFEVAVSPPESAISLPGLTEAIRNYFEGRVS